MRYRSLLVAATAVLLCATTVGATSPELQFLVDNKPVSLPVPAHLENGTTMVPLRVLAEKLGAQVDWQDWGNGTATVNLNTYPHLFSPAPGMGSAISYRSTPQDLQALGASNALTQYLANEQAASLQGNGPAMVRFELLDVETASTCSNPPPEDIAEFCGAGGFRFGARLYYVQLDEPANRATYQYTLAENPLKTEAAEVGKQPANSWYEDIIVDVKPIGTPVTKREGNTIQIEYGAQGWAVDPASKVTKQKVTLTDNPYLIHGSYAR